MRLKVVGGDVYEVKRTHITNKLRDIGNNFCNLLKEVCETSDSSFVWDDKFLDYVCITFKSECSDIVEALVLVEKKEDALAIISEMFDTGSYDATDNNTVVLTEEVWKKYLNM